MVQRRSRKIVARRRAIEAWARSYASLKTSLASVVRLGGAWQRVLRRLFVLDRVVPIRVLRRHQQGLLFVLAFLPDLVVTAEAAPRDLLRLRYQITAAAAFEARASARGQEMGGSARNAVNAAVALGGLARAWHDAPGVTAHARVRAGRSSECERAKRGGLMPSDCHRLLLLRSVLLVVLPRRFREALRPLRRSHHFLLRSARLVALPNRRHEALRPLRRWHRSLQRDAERLLLAELVDKLLGVTRLPVNANDPVACEDLFVWMVGVPFEKKTIDDAVDHQRLVVFVIDV
mmetsp:Transcript_111336/g.314297  ORF Transcript_111336/g.314297 Transcript_111336/m.314297 type:complete len:290 (-) Transcript_111336:753-1622(-)